MSPARVSPRLSVALALSLLLGVGASPAAAQGGDPIATAIGVATAAVERADNECSVQIDPSLSHAFATDPARTTIYRPAGYDVTIGGQQGGTNFRGRDDFESKWLVAGGIAYPQNIDAARLAVRCGADPSDPQRPLDWHRLTHLDPSTGEINIGSTMYSGTRPNAPLLRRVLDRAPLRESVAPVWAPQCKAGRQLVSFTRRVELLGPPSDLSVSVQTFSAGLRRSPVTASLVAINNRVVAIKHGRGILDTALPENLRQFVKYGENEITVQAIKEKTGACNGRSKRQVAISMYVHGRQSWQVTATRPPPITQGNPLTPVPYTLTNLGPSVLLEPVFEVDASIRQTRKQAFGPTATGDKATCTTNDATLTAVCGLEPMQPKEARTVGVAFAATGADRQPGDGTPDFTSWQIHWNFLGSTGFADGSYCLPPAGKTDCSTIGG